MVVIYPKQIQTTTGHSIQYATQKLTNPNNLCSNSTSLAYWGVKNPTYYGVYLRNYPDSVTTASGSYHTPETFYATNWDTSGISDNAIVTNITIEYKWEQISYYCGTSDCYGKFDKPTITVTAKGKNLTTFKGAKPDAIRYGNNTTNESKKNTNNAELSTLHSHKISVEKYNLTIADLKKMKIKFKPAKNTATNYCRIVMQFIRIKINYKDIEAQQPIFKIVKSSLSPEEVKLKDGISEGYTYRCTLQSNVAKAKDAQCMIASIQDDIFIDKDSIRCEPEISGNKYDVNTHIWNIASFNNYQASITFNAYSKNTGTKQIKTTITSKNADSIKRESTNSVNVIEAPNNVKWNVSFDNETTLPNTNQYEFDSKNKTIRKCLKISIERDQDQPDRNEEIIVDTNGWITTNEWNVWQNVGGTVIPTQTSEGVWKFTNLQGTKIEIKTENNGVCPIIPVGEYHITATHSEKNRFTETKRITAYVIDETFPMDFFTLRLEDGSDVRYNSLIFMSGDDLNIPLTYNISDDNNIDNIEIIGETKYIPVHEARYITYSLKSPYDIENAICKLDVYNADTGEDCADIIVSGDNQISIKEGEKNKFCIIDKLNANEEKKIKFIVQSEEEQECYFKLNFLNYDNYETEEWTPAHIYFKDMPNIKLSIETDIDDLTTPNNDIINVYYNIENKSLTDGTNLKFQIKEPASFKVQGTPTYTIYEKNGNTFDSAPSFNERSRLLTFPTLPGATFDEVIKTFDSKQYVLKITYQATKKGIYDFVLSTYDDINTSDDDQWINSATKKVMVNVSSKTLIKTSVSKQHPYIDELIDFTINVKNYIKKQNNFTFIIKDIGSYKFDHDKNDYLLEYYDCSKGEVDNEEDNNKISKWTINNIDINEENELVLSLRPQELGYHIIETTFIDSDGQIQHFENTVNVLERNKQISFNAYHAISTNDMANCSNCDLLTEICDNDFINLNDELYYVCEIKNNNHNVIETPTHLYARLHDDILENGILCSSHDYNIDSNNLIHFQIPKIPSCSSVKVCFKIKPSIAGTFISNFMITNKNAHVYHKNLTINIDEEFYQRKMEHEINIYNFEKTNRYFRYELDANNDIYKFFNQGNDKTLRPIQVEEYNKSSIETYKGTNLKKLVRDIANNSKYVEPELLRIGNNKFAPRGYEIYPDGFIRRFGLLNSEVFHYTGQLPIISHLSDKAMKWDIDSWDMKVWGGSIYDNGVFDLSIDYSKIPTNFNILELDNPIQNLQALVDKTKPFGTQAICYYYTKLYIDLNLNMNFNAFEASNTYNIPLNIPDIGLISLYNRHDNSLAAYYDLFYNKLNTNIDVSTTATMLEVPNPTTLELEDLPFNNFQLKPNISLGVEVYDQQYTKKYISECFDIVQNIYSYNPTLKNIAISKRFNYNGERSRQVSFNAQTNDIYTFAFDDQMLCNIFIDEEEYQIELQENELENFIGYVISNNEKELFKINFHTDIQTNYLQVHVCRFENKNVIHIFCSINEQDFCHIGYLVANDNDNIIISPNNHISYTHTTTEDKIFFKIQDAIQTIKEEPNTIVQFDNKNKWNNLEKIKEEKGYALIENNYDISKECEIDYIQAPILALKYNNINLTNNDEIIDIGFKFKAKTNKENFIDDLNIDVYKNGDAYIPENNIARQIYYPNQVTNVNEKYSTEIIVQQPNISICSACLKTSLGIYDTCPYCGSTKISAYDNKKAVTVCRNTECNWITDGWYDYCPHCLSEDVEKTKVDFNKTVCEHGHVYNDYYSRCPKCFSKNVTHLTNDQTKFSIQDKDTQNIESVVIKSNTNRVNLCNIEVNVEKLKDDIQNLEYLQLHIYGNNYNVDEFYYCEECNQVGLGNVNQCPNCNSENITKYKNNTTMDIYYQSGSYITKLDHDTEYDKLTGEFDIAIDIPTLVQETKTPSFNLLIYAENLLYDDINYVIEQLSDKIDEEQYITLIKNIPILNLSLDNIYYDYKYKNQKEWEGIENIQGNNHTGIKYIVQNEENTEYISFNKFNIANEKYKHLYLNIAGINKADENIDMEVQIINQDEDFYIETIPNINPDLFSSQIDILDFADIKNIKNLKVQIRFKNVTKVSEIILTHVYIITEKEQKKNILHKELQNHQYNITNNGNIYFINTKNLFNLNDTNPYYIDGKQLTTNLVSYFDFGKLANNEYIRLYNIQMVILYKNRYGKISTEYINFNNDEYTKQLIHGSMQKNNTELWGSVKTSINTLNNLEYQIINNNDEKSLQSTPLEYELIQAFTNNIGNISQICLNYDGQIGYPSEKITIQIYDDNQNYPDNLLFEKDIIMPSYSEIITIDVGLDDLDNGQYWFKLIDHSANKNNYHRFYHNDNTKIGNLIHIDSSNNIKRNENMVLSFSINSDLSLRQYYTLPTSLDLDGIDDFKIYHTFYRYNTKSINNAYLSDLQIENGYLYYNEENFDDVEDIITIENKDDNDES